MGTYRNLTFELDIQYEVEYDNSKKCWKLKLTYPDQHIQNVHLRRVNVWLNEQKIHSFIDDVLQRNTVTDFDFNDDDILCWETGIYEIEYEESKKRKPDDPDYENNEDISIKSLKKK